MFQKGDTHSSLKALTAFLILALAFGILYVFYKNQDNIIANGQFKLYVTAATVAAGFLVGLLYLTNKPHQMTKTKTSSSSKAKKKKARK